MTQCARELMRQLLIDMVKPSCRSTVSTTLNAVANLVDLASWAILNENKSNVFESLVTVFGATRRARQVGDPALRMV